MKVEITQRRLNDIQELLNYIEWDNGDEQQHYETLKEEGQKCPDHVYLKICRIQKWLNQARATS